MMKTKVTERFTFEAAHRIEGLGNKNSRIHGHSHEVYVTISGEPDERYGWVIPHEELQTKVGAINTFKNLLRCRELGVESCDGTGWFRGPKMTDTLHRYFRVQAGEEKLPEQMEMMFENG